MMEKSIRRVGYSYLIILIGLGFSFNVTYFTAVWGVFWFLCTTLIMHNQEVQQEKVKLSRLVK